MKDFKVQEQNACKKEKIISVSGSADKTIKI
jgi:hypothetical protein